MSAKILRIKGTTITFTKNGQVSWTESVKQDMELLVNSSTATATGEKRLARLSASISAASGSPRAHCNVNLYDKNGALFTSDSGNVLFAAANVVTSFNINTSGAGATGGTSIYADVAPDLFTTGKLEFELFGKMSDLSLMTEVVFDGYFVGNPSQSPKMQSLGPSNMALITGNGTLKIEISFECVSA